MSSINNINNANSNKNIAKDVNSNNHSNIDKHNNNNNNINNNNNNNNNINNKRTEGILSSPSNPATLRRLSQANGDEESMKKNEVSWHKRVVVHRVPRSDASRSMFHAKGKESNNSSQCCIIL